MNDWRYRQDQNVRQPLLSDAFLHAGLKIIGFSLLVLVLDAIKAKVDAAIGVKLWALDLLDGLITLLELGTYLPSGIRDASWAAALYQVLGWIHGAVSVLHQILALAETGWAFVIDALARGISLALGGGIFGAAVSVVVDLLGSALLSAGLAFAHAQLQEAFNEYADLTYQSKISIDEWCQQYGQRQCEAPPPQV